MRISLQLLDRISTIAYENPVPIFRDNDLINPIGSCEVWQDAGGKHFGETSITLSPELYFYYRNACSDDGIFWLSGFQLRETPYPDKPTSQIKDKIVI